MSAPTWSAACWVPTATAVTHARPPTSTALHIATGRRRRRHATYSNEMATVTVTEETAYPSPGMRSTPTAARAIPRATAASRLHNQPCPRRTTSAPAPAAATRRPPARISYGAVARSARPGSPALRAAARSRTNMPQAITAIASAVAWSPRRRASCAKSPKPAVITIRIRARMTRGSSIHATAMKTAPAASTQSAPRISRMTPTDLPVNQDRAAATSGSSGRVTAAG